MGSSVNTVVGAAKTSAAAAGLVASAGANHLADSLFTSLLSEIQPAPVPVSNQNASSQNSSSQQQPAAHSTAGTNNNNNAVNSNPQSSTQQAGNSPAPARNSNPVANKSSHHDAKSVQDKNNAQNNSDSDQSDNNAAPVSTAAPAPPAQRQPTDKSDHADQCDQPAASDVNENSSVSTADGGTDATVIATVLAQNVVTQTSVGTDIQTPSASDAPASPNDQTECDPAKPDNATDAQMLLLLQQLERVAAAKLENMQAANTNAAVLTTAPGTDPTETIPANMQGVQDLKSLLKAALTAPASFGAPTDSTIAPTVNLAPDNIDLTAGASLAAGSSSQSAAPTTDPSSSKSDAKWMNESFLNLFNAPNDSSQIPAPVAGVVTAALSAGLTANGGDGASLDADAHGQNGANTRGSGLNAPALNNELMPQSNASQASSPYDFASQLSALRATKGGATGLPTPVEQVVLQLSRNLAKDGSSQMSIQLRPAELGRVDVKLSMSADGKVQGTVTADNPTTLGLLLKDVRGLERALQEAGLRADPGSLQFNLRGDGQSGSFGQNMGNQPGSSGGASGDLASSISVPGEMPETYYVTPGGVNMRV